MYNVQGCDCSIRLVRAGFDALALAALQRESAASPLSTTTTIARKKLTQIIHEGMNAWRGELRGSLAGREAFIAVAIPVSQNSCRISKPRMIRDKATHNETTKLLN